MAILSKTELFILLVLALGSWVIYDLDLSPAADDLTSFDYTLYDGYTPLNTLIELMDPANPSSMDIYFTSVQQYFADVVEEPEEGWTGPPPSPDAYQVLSVDYSASDEARKDAFTALHKTYNPWGLVTNDGTRAIVKALRREYVRCRYDHFVDNREGAWRGLKAPVC